MDFFEIAAVVIVLSAFFGYLNVRLLKLPNTIGLMVIAIVFTVVLLLCKSLQIDWMFDAARAIVENIEFEEVLMNIMLGFLLFAGALHTNFDQLRVQRWPILVFATLGVLSSTFIVGTAVYFIFPFLNLHPKYIHCLLFGALISPTDPIAVLGILKKAGVPKKLETKIVGESLFNDGVGVVVFLTIMTIATGSVGHGGHAEVESASPAVVFQDSTPVEPDAGNVISLVALQDGQQAAEHKSSEQSADTKHAEDDSDNEDAEHSGESHESDGHAVEGEHTGETTVSSVFRMFVQEVLGGILFGLAIGYLTFWLLKSIDDYEIEVMITLACVMGGYSLATYLHLSAPLAVVVAGLIVGHDTVRGTAMSRETEEYVDKFWELMDMLMNAILFVLIGLEMILLAFNREYLYAGLLCIAIVLIARYVSLLLPVTFFRKRLEFVPHTTTIMCWGGLRGGISIALALTLPADCNRELFLTVTYIVVVFSIIVQGLSVGKLANRLLGKEAVEAVAGHQ